MKHQLKNAVVKVAVTTMMILAVMPGTAFAKSKKKLDAKLEPVVEGQLVAVKKKKAKFSDKWTKEKPKLKGELVKKKAKYSNKWSKAKKKKAKFSNKWTKKSKKVKFSSKLVKKEPAIKGKLIKKKAKNKNMYFSAWLGDTGDVLIGSGSRK